MPRRETAESIYTRRGLERVAVEGIVGIYVHLVGGRSGGDVNGRGGRTGVPRVRSAGCTTFGEHKSLSQDWDDPAFPSGS